MDNQFVSFLKFAGSYFLPVALGLFAGILVLVEKGELIQAERASSWFSFKWQNLSSLRIRDLYKETARDTGKYIANSLEKLFNINEKHNKFNFFMYSVLVSAALIGGYSDKQYFYVAFIVFCCVFISFLYLIDPRGFDGGVNLGKFLAEIILFILCFPHYLTFIISRNIFLGAVLEEALGSHLNC